MLNAADYDKLQQIMEESPRHKEVISRLLESHRMEIRAISHEIRNPLALVYSSLQLIESGHPEVQDFRHWKEMRRDVEYMTRLLEELSAFQNGETLHLTETPMSSYLRALALSFAASLADTDIEFVSRIGPELPVLLVDQIKLRQALLNLLANARDALLSSADMKKHLQLSFCSQAESGQLLLTVADNGCGIRPEDLDAIFRPFVTRKANGTGLGLAIADRTAKAHRGKLTVSSEPGKGAVFSLSLPIEQDPA